MTSRETARSAAGLARQLSILERDVHQLKLRKPSLATSSIEDGAIDEYTQDGTLASSTGKQADGSHVSMPFTGPKPAAPVAPTLQAVPGAVEVRWNGKFTEAQVSSLDFKHVAIHLSTSPAVDTTPSGQVATIRGELGDVATLVAAAGTVYVALVAWTSAGKASEPSEVTSVTVPESVDAAALNGRLDTAETELEAAQGRLDTAETDISDAFGSLNTVDNRIATAKAQAAAAAQTMADTALNLANQLTAQAIAKGQSLVRNGDFEAGQDGWANNAWAAVEEGQSRSGTKALRMGPSTVNVWPQSEWVPATTGRTYYLEAWFKRSGTELAPNGVAFVIQPRTAAGGTATFIAGQVDASAIPTDSWVKVAATYTVTTTDATHIRFAPWTKASNNIYYVDDFLAIDVTEAHAASQAADAAQTAALAAHAAAGEAGAAAQAALTMAGTKSRVYYADTAASGTATAEGDLWRQRDAQEDIVAEWRWNGVPPAGAWVKTMISSSAISNLDVGKLTAGSAAINTLVSQKIAAAAGQFLELDVGQLRVTGTASIDQAVVDQLWTDVVRSRLITAQMISGDAINGMVITGSTVRNKATGKRVQMDSVGFRSFNAAGLETVRVDGENNLITGKITTNEPGQPGVILVPRSSSGVTGMWFSQNGTEDGNQPAIFTDASGNITIRPKVQTPLQTVFIMGNLIIKDKFTSEVGMSAQGPFYSSQGESVVQSLKIAAHPTSSVAPNAIIATSPYGVMYRSTSSRRYKKYISKWEPDPDGVLALVPKRWQDRKQADVPADSRYYVGFIAEEVAEVYPELVSFMDYEDGNGPVPESVDYERFCAVLTLKAQQQENRLAQLATENAELKDRLSAIESRLSALEPPPPAVP